MCSYPESRFGQCYQWLAVWPVPVIAGGTWPAPSRCRTHALLAAPRPPKNWQSRRLPAYLSLTTVQYISVCVITYSDPVHRTMECDTSDLSYIITVLHDQATTYSTLLSTVLYDTTRRSRHHHYTVVEPSVSRIMHVYKLSEKRLPLTQQIKRPLLDW